MKILENKRNIKIIALILVLSTILLAITPNYVMAEDADENEGGTLFKPVFKLFAGVGDLVTKGLQKIFIGNGDITVENPREIK